MSDNDTLITRWGELRDEIGPLRDEQLRVEADLQRNMENDGATEFAGDHGTATLKAPISYDHDVLDGLYEFIDPGTLAEQGAVRPAHTEIVPRKWNVTKLKPLAKRGKDIRAIIEASRIEGRGKLSIKYAEGTPQRDKEAQEHNKAAIDEALYHMEPRQKLAGYRDEYD